MNQRPHLAEGETPLISGAAGTPRRGELKNINRAWPDLHLPDGEGALVLSPAPPRIPPRHYASRNNAYSMRFGIGRRSDGRYSRHLRSPL